MTAIPLALGVSALVVVWGAEAASTAGSCVMGLTRAQIAKRCKCQVSPTTGLYEVSCPREAGAPGPPPGPRIGTLTSPPYTGTPGINRHPKQPTYTMQASPKLMRSHESTSLAGLGASNGQSAQPNQPLVTLEEFGKTDFLTLAAKPWARRASAPVSTVGASSVARNWNLAASSPFQ